MGESLAYDGQRPLSRQAGFTPAQGLIREDMAKQGGTTEVSALVLVRQDACQEWELFHCRTK